MVKRAKFTKREMEIAVEAPHLMRNIQFASKCGATLFDIVELGARTGYKNLSPIFRKGLTRINKQGESVDVVLEDIAREIDFEPISSPIYDLIRGNLKVDEVQQDYLARKARGYYSRQTQRMASGFSAIASDYKMPLSILTSTGMLYFGSQFLGGILGPIYPLFIFFNLSSTYTTIHSMKRVLKDSMVLPTIVDNLDDSLDGQEYYLSNLDEDYKEKPNRFKSWAKKVLPVELSESTRVIQQMNGLIDFLGVFGENMMNGYSREYSLSEAAKKYKAMVSDNSGDHLVRSLIFDKNVFLDDIVSKFELEDDLYLTKTIKDMERRDIVKFIRGKDKSKSKSKIIGAKLKNRKKADAYLHDNIRGGAKLKLAETLMEASRIIYEGGGSFDEAWSHISSTLHPSFREDFKWLSKISSKNSIRAGELALMLANNEYKKELELIEDRREKLEDSVDVIKDVQILGMKVAGFFYGMGQGFFTGIGSAMSGSLLSPPNMFDLLLYGTTYFALDFPLTAMYLTTDTYYRDDTLDRMKQFVGYYLLANLGMTAALRLVAWNSMNNPIQP